jgi:acetylornithine deacetylase/succinyl-diaminopimelate desuccinylase-like protein
MDAGALAEESASAVADTGQTGPLLSSRAMPILLALLAAVPPAPALRDDVRAWRLAHEKPVLQEFAGLLAIPNLASDAPNIRANAVRIAEMLGRRGVATRLLEVEGSPPAVYGELKTPGATRTVLIYAHYDGQPVDRSKWTSDPWQPVLRDEGGRPVELAALAGATRGEWRLYARSASDDKAPIIGVLAALDALRAAAVPPSINLRLFFEGEEEAGSPHMAAFLDRYGELLRADLWLLCDGPVHQSRRMQLYYGARGTTDLEITVYGPARPLHDGHYGNWAPNPAVALVHLLAGLRDPDGRIKVAGFYDDVRPPTAAEQRALEAIPNVDAPLRRELALAETEAGGARLVDRVMLPALNGGGIEAGRVGALAANAIPTEARASIDFRLVPDQTLARLREKVEAHLRAEGYTVVHDAPDLETRRAQPRVVRLEWGAGYPAARTPLDLPAARALASVVSEAIGEPVIEAPTLGGSVPMYLFVERLYVPVIGLPIANHDNNQHAADENLRLQNLWDAIEVYAAVLARLGPALEVAKH